MVIHGVIYKVKSMLEIYSDQSAMEYCLEIMFVSNAEVFMKKKHFDSTLN